MSRVRISTSVLCICLAVAAMSTPCGSAKANDVPEYSLEKKVRLADSVFIGYAMGRKREGDRREYAHVRIDTVLKGNVRGYVDVLTKGEVAEFDLQCCEVGKGYLFFVVKARGGKYESVNGPFGVCPLQSKANEAGLVHPQP